MKNAGSKKGGLAGGKAGGARAPMPSKIVEVKVKVGDRVEAGSTASHCRSDEDGKFLLPLVLTTLSTATYHHLILTTALSFVSFVGARSQGS